MEEKNIIKYFGILVIISVLVGLFVLGKTIFFYLITVKKWKKTEAEIIECEVKWYNSETDSDSEGWKEMIKYKYFVNSIEYENDCVTKNIKFLSPFKRFVKKNSFTLNQRIEISYDPKNPKNSIIDTKLNPLTVVIPIVFYALVYIFFLRNNVV